MQGIGQLLWKLREKEGIRQKQLCLGISSVSKYARIEADQQEIDFFLIDRIMGRLGKSVERLTYILPRDIYNIYELRQEIQQKICQKKWEEAKQCLLEYEKNKRAKEPLHQQFIEQEYAQIAWLRGKSVETVCEHLEKAIVQTMPEAEIQRKTGITDHMENRRKTRKLPEQIADRLREMIIQESIKTGAKLPAEAELMERFGVSRSTVREAVKILQTEHIVDIRQGQGTFLCAMPGLARDPLGLRFADQGELTAQLLETRLMIEPNVAMLAAQRRQEKHLQAMKALLDKMDNAYLHGEDYTPFDCEFHSMIAQCTGNDVIMRLLPTIHESIQAGYHHTQRVEGSYQRASQCHLDLYRGIAERDGERARQAAQRHMIQTMHDSGVDVPPFLLT